jgi:hypothetical protein
MASSVSTAARQLLVLIGVVLLATPAAAQSGAASGLAGRVADATGASLAGVKIIITGRDACIAHLFRDEGRVDQNLAAWRGYRPLFT